MRTVFDTELPRVGFLPSKPVRDVLCPAKRVCNGDYYGPFNVCLRPDCQLFLFMEASDGACAQSSSFKIAVTVIIVILSLARLAFGEVRQRLLNRLGGEMQQSQFGASLSTQVSSR
jgi:hypothetical protein